MQKKIHPYLTIIIPTYKDWERLQICLDALAMQTYSSVCFEIIVINNDSFTNPPKSLRLPSNATIVNEDKAGSYAARNKGLQIAKGDVIAFTDSDCIPNFDWLENAATFLLKSEEHHRVTGPVSFFKDERGSWLAWRIDQLISFRQKENVINGVSVTANLIVKRTLFDDVGLFNQELMSGGDFEWNRRATEKKYQLAYLDGVEVLHPARVSLSEVLIKLRRITGGEMVKAKQNKCMTLFVLRHFNPPVKTWFKALKQDKSILSVSLLIFTILWALKLSMLIEIGRISFGGKPVR